MSAPALLAVSHGTSSPAGRRAVAALVQEVARRRPDLQVVPASVDVQQPDVPTALAGVPGAARIVPLLLSAGFHVYVDLAEAVQEHPRTDLAAALGPDPRLVQVLVRRLREAGLTEGDRVVLAAAGSSDARAVRDCHVVAEMLAVALGRPVTTAFLSAAAPTVHDAVAAARGDGGPVAVATYLLAPGYFADLAARCGADRVSDPLLVDDSRPPVELVDLVLDRYLSR